MIWLSWSQEHGNWPKLTNKPGFLPFKKAFCTFEAMFLSYCLLEVYFHVKIQLFVTLKFDQDPDTDEDQDTHWIGSLDPDPQ